MRTNVYIDGFNLYYRALKGTPYRWLDIRALSSALLPAGFNINRIRYFTAKVKEQAPQASRQQIYLRALRTLPNLDIHFGTFYGNKVIKRPLATPIPGLPKYVEVKTREEKGSDVNLASYLVLDAADNDFDAALVISNDSDLRTPVMLVQHRYHRHVIAANPSRTAKWMLPGDTLVRIKKNHLSASQFPSPMNDVHGKAITRPTRWDTG